jgi:hypothetical protein
MKVVGSPLYLSRDLVRPLINRHRASRSEPLLVVNVHSWVGLFAHLEWFLEIAAHCDRHGLTPCFMSTSPQYVASERGRDWYRYFFTNPRLSSEERERIEAGAVPVCRIDGIRQLGLPENYDLGLNLREASPLVRKYIGVKPEVTERVDAFVRHHLADRTVLGIHYRGTDKEAEAPRLSYCQVRRSIDTFLEENGDHDCLFVSSDEQDFVDFIESEFEHSIPVVYHEDRERAKAGVAVHRSKSGDRFRKAEEAVLNCLLLSRCDALMKTPSILSGWSRLFNPDLRVIVLTSPFAGQLWFPDRDLVEETPSRWLQDPAPGPHRS